MNLDPQVRQKLLQESRKPFQGIRRIAWLLLFASAGLGLFIMLFRLSTSEVISRGDISIQLGAFLIFGTLVFFDRDTVG